MSAPKRRRKVRDLNQQAAKEVSSQTGQPLPQGTYKALLARQQAKRAPVMVRRMWGDNEAVHYRLNPVVTLYHKVRKGTACTLPVALIPVDQPEALIDIVAATLPEVHVGTSDGSSNAYPDRPLAKRVLQALGILPARRKRKGGATS